MIEYLKCLNLSEEQKNKLVEFSWDVIETNKVLNLTAITDEKEFAYKHIVDSLSVMENLGELLKPGTRILDVGTGAGFPGIPLAIALPECEFTLTDSLLKRLRFIDGEIDKLGLKNVRTVHGRCEDLARDAKMREQYDVVLSRAVANLSTLCEYDSPFIHKNGKLIAYKSAEVDSEIMAAGNAMKVLNLDLQGFCEYSLPENMGSRKLLIINKLSTTPKQYPRKAGTPSKSPL